MKKEKRIIALTATYEDGIKVLTLLYDDGTVDERFTGYDPEVLDIQDDEIIGLTSWELCKLIIKKYEDLFKDLREHNLI